jgi:hypothetical protein
MSGVRITAYLSVEEERDLRDRAEAEGTSINYLVRTGIRVVLGRPIPQWLLEQLEEVLNEKAR